MVNNILKYSSKGVNFLFHPLLMPSYFIAILLFISSMMVNNPLSVKVAILKMVGFITILTPILSMGLSSLINRLMGEKNPDTYYDFLVSTVLSISYALAIYVLKDYITLHLSLRLFLAPLLIVGFYHLFRAVGFRFSVWTASFGALFTFLYLLSISYITGLMTISVVVIILGGLVGSARICDDKDTLSGVAVGYLVGLLSAILSFYLPTLW